ncbi:unnamed protein product [Eruca vesicaria subsp. sativa]|uniref:TAFII28-like protein domain-containing protein n=1 Tax=Eruca vesicaria subsp. sativa TaxID=29727 RepID=A0ABC8LND8_ERUVS|nr:unnamed protein product [Eruca vesicaria subsp. sativa]
MKDSFEAAIEEQQEWPPESPGGGGGDRPWKIEQTPEEEDERALKRCKTSEEEDNMGAEFTRYPTPAKMTILTQLTEDQMSRYESFRRSALHKSNMKKLLQSITGQKVSDTLNIVVCGIAKMFVGELVETARVEMGKRKDSGPIRPSHIRESYRRLKLQGKVPKRSVPRLFR